MGVLGRDPETKQFPNGGSITTFSVATIDNWKDQTTSERKQATEWHRIATSNRLAIQYLKKGGKVYEGFYWQKVTYFSQIKKYFLNSELYLCLRS